MIVWNDRNTDFEVSDTFFVINCAKTPVAFTFIAR